MIWKLYQNFFIYICLKKDGFKVFIGNKHIKIKEESLLLNEENYFENNIYYDDEKYVGNSRK